MLIFVVSFVGFEGRSRQVFLVFKVCTLGWYPSPDALAGTRRNTRLLDDGSFYESGHLTGSQDMVEIVRALLIEQKRRISEGRKDTSMPFRPDHGIKILHDFDHKYNPGYRLIGRLKGLSEIEGLMAGIERFIC